MTSETSERGGDRWGGSQCPRGESRRDRPGRRERRGLTVEVESRKSLQYNTNFSTPPPPRLRQGEVGGEAPVGGGPCGPPTGARPPSKACFRPPPPPSLGSLAPNPREGPVGVRPLSAERRALFAAYAAARQPSKESRGNQCHRARALDKRSPERASTNAGLSAVQDIHPPKTCGHRSLSVIVVSSADPGGSSRFSGGAGRPRSRPPGRDSHGPGENEDSDQGGE